MSLSAEQRAELGRILEAERARLVRRLRRHGAELGEDSVGGYSQHMAEHASSLTARETAALMASEEGRRLVEVDRALTRLVRDPGAFGGCRECGEPVGYARLEAIPYTDLCIECKRVEEERAR